MKSNGKEDSTLQLKAKVQRLIPALCLLTLGVITCAPEANAGLYVESLPQTELLHDGCLHIFILGTGNPEAEMQNIRKPSCTAIVVDDKVFFFDAGEGAVQTAAALVCLMNVFRRSSSHTGIQITLADLGRC